MEDRARQGFETDELAVVLSHYDIGVIESITPFTRGSRASPKVGIVASAGKFLLKKRAAKRRSKRRVALAHAIQRHLAERSFPIARLVPTRDDGAPAARIGEEVYELFEFVPGEEYDATPEKTREAGRVLALFHQQLADFEVPENASRGSYHDVVGIRTALNSMASSISSHDSVVGYESDLDATVQVLYDEYDAAAERVNDIGDGNLPMQIVHADWHPGNMLYRRDKIVAVLDYDACRLAERVIDVANGMLHFSLLTGRHPNEWPDHPDEDRMAAFCEGYRELIALHDAERNCLPHLMIEAMIAESVLPIMQTGHFGKWTGFSFMKMVTRKVGWFRENAEEISEIAEGTV